MDESNIDSNPTNKGPNPPEVVGGLTVPPFESQVGQNAFPKNAYYPLTYDKKQDRVIISQYEYKRSDVRQTESQLISEELSVTKFLGSVTLPMPNDLSEANSVGWGEDSLSNIAALAMPNMIGAVMKAGTGNIAGAADETMNGIIKPILESGGVKSRFMQSVATSAAAQVLKKININVNPEAYISRATSAAINPNLELLFNGPKLRQFSLAYKMTARSQEEATQIRTILRFFKKGMAPRRSNNSESSFFLGTPNVFRVKFSSGNNVINSIGQFKTCALISFSANYTPDGFYAAYEDTSLGAGGSQPIAVVMQMGFTELTPVFNDEYDNTTLDVVGPNNFTAPLPQLSSLETPSPNEIPNIPGGPRGRPAGTTITPAGAGSRTKSETIGTGQGGITKPIGGR